MFRQVYEALTPGGLFIFDVALPGRAGGGRRRSYTAGHDWACLFEAVEHPPTQTLTRHITSFRKVNGSYRRDQEVHHLKLHDRNAIAAQLRAIGFRVRTVRAYGESRFPHGYAGFVARKP